MDSSLVGARRISVGHFLKFIVKIGIKGLGPLIKAILGMFYDRKIFLGRHFTDKTVGYRWALKSIWLNRILRIGRNYPWPTAPTVIIANPSRLHWHPDDLNNFQVYGTYFQNGGADIYIGRGTYIAQHVAIITANHSVDDLGSYDESRPVVLGEKCWIGVNAVILPGVVLGNGTIVGAGAVVTKSFPEGRQVIAGVPAQVVRTLDR